MAIYGDGENHIYIYTHIGSHTCMCKNSNHRAGCIVRSWGVLLPCSACLRLYRVGRWRYDFLPCDQFEQGKTPEPTEREREKGLKFPISKMSHASKNPFNMFLSLAKPASLHKTSSLTAQRHGSNGRALSPPFLHVAMLIGGLFLRLKQKKESEERTKVRVFGFSRLSQFTLHLFLHQTHNI